MKKTLKIFSIIMILLVLVLTITACGDKKDEETAKKEFSMGEWKDGVYENSFLKYKFELPENWTASTDKEIATIMQLGEDALESEGKYISEAAKLSAVYFAVAREGTGNNVLIMAEKIASTVTLEEYMETLRTQLTSLTGFNYTVIDEGTAKLGNAECSTLTFNESELGVVQRSYVYVEGEYFILVTMTSVEGESLFDELENHFKAN